MSGPVSNGWSRYEELVLFRLDQLEGAVKKEREQAEERHRCLMRKFAELDSKVAEVQANRRATWLKVAGISFVVAYAVAHGVSLWELLGGLL